MADQTIHSLSRSRQRGLSDDAIDYILHFGRRYHCPGALIYYLRRKDLPSADLRCDFCTRLIGTGVVLSHDRRTVITVWRNRKGGLRWLRTAGRTPMSDS